METNKIISGKENGNYNIELKKTRIFNTLPVVRGCRPGDSL
jgi:hypothetical protein